jgi:hypothetical protein
MIESGNGRPSDQNLHDSVKGLVNNIQEEIGAIQKQ